MKKQKIKKQKSDYKPEFLKQNYIYEIGSIQNRPQAHASNIIRGKPEEGFETLYTAWFCGTREGNSDVAIMFSKIKYMPKSDPREIKFSYTTPKVIADDKEKACGNPVLYLDEENTLHFWYTVFFARDDPRGRKGERKLLYKKSLDNGETWNGPIEFSDRDGLWVRNPLLVMKDGTWILPINDETTYIKKYKTRWSSRFVFSYDKGVSWEFSDLYSIKKGMIQPSVVQFDDGELFCVNRSRNKHVIVMRSTDNGESWTKPMKIDLYNPNSNVVVLLRENQDLVMVYNPLKRGRYNISLAISKDRGKTWSHLLDLQNERGCEFSYPCILETNDGLIHITYTYKRKTISHDVIIL